MDGGEEVSSTFVIPGSHGSKILEPVDASLHYVAALVRLCIECRWTSALGTSLQPRLFGVFALGTHAADATTSQQAPKLPGPIRFVHAHARRALARSSHTDARNTHHLQKWPQKGRVVDLALGNQDGQGSSVSVGEHMDFAGPASTTCAEPLAGDQAPFSSLALVLRAPVALRCALMCVLSTAAPSQSMLPSASTCICSAVRMRCQVPSRDHATNRS